MLRAESILPPGQSGFVSIPGLADGTGSPHLYDQLQPFIDFRWKPATFDQPGDVEVPHPGVKIVRDGYGVPAVTGDTEDLMWWGAGYAIAQDRLFELELFRRATTGRLADIAGRERVPRRRPVVRQDFYTPAELDAQFAALPAALRSRFEAYRDGINAWIDHVQSTRRATCPASSPPIGISRPGPWTVRDSVAIGVYLARTIAPNADPEGLELANLRGAPALGRRRRSTGLVPLRTPGALTTIPAARGHASPPSRVARAAQERAAFRRSVAFARGLPFPDRSAPRTRRRCAPRSPAARLLGPGGSYMFAVRDGGRATRCCFNGPQLGFTAPEQIVELELHAPGFDVRGITAPGAPVIGAGHNGQRRLGRSRPARRTSTTSTPRSSCPATPSRTCFAGKARKMDCRDEAIAYHSPPSR